MNDPIPALDLIEIGFWASGREDPVPPTAADLTRFQMGIADPHETAAIFHAASSLAESANLLAEVSALRVQLENLADLDLRAFALEGGLRGQVAQEILDIRQIGRSAMKKSDSGSGESISSLFRALASGLVTLREAASVRALRLPPQPAQYRDSGAVRGSWDGEDLVIPLPAAVKGTVELRVEGDLLLSTVDAAGGELRLPVSGGRESLRLLVDDSDSPVIRYKTV